MFARMLSTAIVSGLLLAGPLQTVSFAHGDAPIDAYSQPFASAHNKDGSSVTSRGNRDGSRTITNRDARGKVIKQQRVGGKKPARKPKAQELPSASSTDPNTGVTTEVHRNRDGSRTVTKTDRHGRVISKRTVGGRGIKVNSASSRDANGAVRAAVTIGLFGLAIGLMH
jgi:hypothetical protein